MEQVQAIVALAAQRGSELALPYTVALLPQEAFYLMEHSVQVVLVDVRSAAEWQFVGNAPNTLCLEWRSFPGMQLNPGFVAELRRKVDPDATLMLMCRSGVRSDEAARAAQQAGFLHIYNVLEGFEGEKDAAGQRGHINGWKARGLPWVQG